jgi:hypothetical protein
VKKCEKSVKMCEKCVRTPLDTRSFMAAGCDKDHYLIVSKCLERLAMNKRKSQIFNMERFNIKKLNEVESKANEMGGSCSTNGGEEERL